MAGTPETVVLDPAKFQLEQANAAAIRGRMLQETVSGIGKSIMEGVTQYQDIKDKENKRQLAAITTAGALSGGMDKLPQDTLNRLPGILGFDLPRNEKGDVVVTPDIQTVVQRYAIQEMQRDPSLASVAAGFQKPRADPSEIGAQFTLENMREAADRERTDKQIAQNREDNATRIKVAEMERQTRLEEKKMETGKTKPEDQLSPYVLDPQSNNIMTEQQWYTAHPGQQIPPKMTYRDVSTHTAVQTGNANAQAKSSAALANQARAAKLNYDLQRAMTDPTPEMQAKVKLLTDMAKLSLGTGKDADFIKPIFENEMKDWMRKNGWGEDDIKSALEMAGPGGLAGMWNSMWDYFKGQTAVASPPLAKDPRAGEDPNLQGKPAGGTVLKGNDAKKFLGIP